MFGQAVIILNAALVVGALCLSDAGAADYGGEQSGPHWSLKPVQQVEPPDVDYPDWSRPIDRFVHAKLMEQELVPAPLADRRTLIRRATFDLIGLPPTQVEIADFLAEPAEDEMAFANLVDRLLTSPHYGERWGRHWLDIARYADTQGDVADYPIPDAWMYRNWVIDALNADMPYNQFVQAQIAGDVLARDAEDPQQFKELHVATGFIALSRRFGNTKSFEHHLTIEDTIDTIGRGILGLTLRCARCHDHKFDPLSTKDYYGLYGIFASTRYPSMGSTDEKTPSDLAPLSREEHVGAELDEYWELLERYQLQLRNQNRVWLMPKLAAYRRLASDLSAAEKNGEDTTELLRRREELLDTFEGKYRELMEHGVDWVKQQKEQLATNPPCQTVFAVSEGDSADVREHLRGNPKTPGDVVPRGVPHVIAGPHAPVITPSSGSGRLELARWMTSPENPLTARVIVNRVWHYHFGRGIVSTPSNFGIRGRPPSHPELLDYLASDFMAEGWSLKGLHRRIMRSRTYRLASLDVAGNAAKDPDNTYLWEYRRRRLEAEAIRDAMLAVSGQLDRTPSVSHPFLPWHQWGYSLNAPFKEVFRTQRRSVYLMTQRLFEHPLLALFDVADTTVSTAVRKSSSVPGQTLFLMNSPFVREQAAAFAERLTDSQAEDVQRVELAYQLALGRPPNEQESTEVIDYLRSCQARWEDRSEVERDEAQQQAWCGLARVLLSSNEFFFVE